MQYLCVCLFCGCCLLRYILFTFFQQSFLFSHTFKWSYCGRGEVNTSGLFVPHAREVQTFTGINRNEEHAAFCSKQTVLKLNLLVWVNDRSVWTTSFQDNAAASHPCTNTNTYIYRLLHRFVSAHTCISSTHTKAESKKKEKKRALDMTGMLTDSQM